MEKRLTTKDINKLVAAKDYGKHCDGGNLYLQGSEEYGTWSWLFRFKSPEIGKERCPEIGKERWMGLGSIDTFTLAEAREEARKHRQVLARGIDPIEQRLRERKETRDNALKGITFRDAAEKYMAMRLPQLRNDKHAKQWRDSMQGLYRELGAFPAASLGESDINAALASVALRAPETARRTAQRARTVINWVKAGMPALVKVEREHHPALPVEEIPGFMEALRCKDSITARALEFTILTAARTGEAIGATWDEIDGGLWTIPADRTKGYREHIVPLSRAVREMLAALPRVEGCPYLFPGRGRGHINSRGMIELLGGMHKARAREGRPPWVDKKTKKLAVVHGFRSSFRDWAGDYTSHPRDVTEAALAHKDKDQTEAAYRRRTAVQKRTPLMEDWAQYCDSPAVKSDNVVVPMRKDMAS